MNGPLPTIVVAEGLDESALDKLRSAGRVTLLSSCTERDLRASVVDCDALVVRTSAQVTAAVIAAASRLRVIGRAGVGVDNIDLEAAWNRGVTVVYTPASSTEAVADLTLGMILSLLRGVVVGDAAVRSRRFLEARRATYGPELGTLTVGIVGLGRIGRAVARRCRLGFGSTILFHDIREMGWLDFAAESATLNELLERADIVSLHLPLTDATRGLMNLEKLDRMKPGSLLINTSRGAVVDGQALAVVLRNGRIAGAGLDVFDPEPLSPDHPLMSAPNLLLTPHIGSRSPGGLARMNGVVDDVLRVLRGESPLEPVIRPS